MSHAIAFDSHRFVKNLPASGFTEAQAEPGLSRWMMIRWVPQTGLLATLFGGVLLTQAPDPSCYTRRSHPCWIQVRA